MGLVWFLGAGKTQTEEANSSAGDQGVVDVEATEVQEPKQEEDEFAAWSQRELDEFDRKLMGGSAHVEKRWCSVTDCRVVQIGWVQKSSACPRILSHMLLSSMVATKA